MITAELEFRPVLNILWMDFDGIFKTSLQWYKEQYWLFFLLFFWGGGGGRGGGGGEGRGSGSPAIAPQIANLGEHLGNMGVMSYLVGDVRSLSAHKYLILGVMYDLELCWPFLNIAWQIHLSPKYSQPACMETWLSLPILCWYSSWGCLFRWRVHWGKTVKL